MVVSTSRFTIGYVVHRLRSCWEPSGRVGHPIHVVVLNCWVAGNAAGARLALSYSLILAKISRPDASSYDVTFVDLSFSDLALGAAIPNCALWPTSRFVSCSATRARRSQQALNSYLKPPALLFAARHQTGKSVAARRVCGYCAASSRPTNFRRRRPAFRVPRSRSHRIRGKSVARVPLAQLELPYHDGGSSLPGWAPQGRANNYCLHEFSMGFPLF